jgi:hypothetical protein
VSHHVSHPTQKHGIAASNRPNPKITIKKTI